MTYEQNRRDANEAELVALWREVGCAWIPMSKDAGFDGVLVCPRTGTHLVEVKNPAVRWKLTDSELAVKIKVEQAGGKVDLVETEADALRLVGVSEI